MKALAPLTFLMLLAVPLASAGTAEAPEVTDAEGDASACFGPAGNEYADLVSAWVSDETATSFVVNIALAKWTADQLGTASGYTIQFTHQGKQFGVAAAYIPPPMASGWEFSNGYIDLETQELKDFEDAEGSFTPGTPAILSIVFDKANFPHGEAMDHALHTFVGGSADFKNGIAGFVTGEELDMTICDTVESSATYMFMTGDHSMSGMGAANETSDGDMDHAQHQGGAATDAGDDVDAAAAPAGDDGAQNDTPAPGLMLVALAGVAAALAARRRRRA